MKIKKKTFWKIDLSQFEAFVYLFLYNWTNIQKFKLIETKYLYKDGYKYSSHDQHKGNCQQLGKLELHRRIQVVAGGHEEQDRYTQD